MRFVWDNTNVSRAEREKVARSAREAGFEVFAFYFEPDFSGSLQRNARRRGSARIPDAGVKHMARRLERPSWDEGYTAIFSVWTLGDGTFRVEEW